MRLAVIGVGDVAYRDYLPQFGRIAHLGTVSLVIARNLERTQAAARFFRVLHVDVDWRRALDSDVDAVINLTPAPIHGEINLALANAGRHFYSEKPFARDVAEGKAIIAAAARTGCVIAAAPSVMVYPQVLRAAEVLRSGELGAIHSARATATTAPPPWGGYVGDHAPFFSADVGPLSDMGVYPLHALTGLLGNVVTVSALSSRTRSSFAVNDGPFAGTTVPVEVDDNWQIALALDSGILASLQVAYCITQPGSCHLEIAGEAGSMVVPILDPSEPLRITIGGTTRDEPVGHHRNDGPDHLLGVLDFLEAIRDSREPVINSAHALHVVAVRRAIEEAARSGSHIQVNH